jgi:hypothetical protein
MGSITKSVPDINIDLNVMAIKTIAIVKTATEYIL